ncbi:hypothetical protein [Caenibius sp. WL]|uniref:hypothetical protein n=1 Tax=Caenibius sp. WL TaxID=2872646 RepID=UPI001C999D8B|nr:hypothetical protein [Caenibius sp. WL]QZP09624.1 hypothetical protein K5X80_07770 [Caenibius sp. WL]
MRRYILNAILASILLAGCSADYPLKAVFKDGGPYFEGASDDWYFGRTGFCPTEFSVRSDDGQLVWQIETDELTHPCELFPLRFGSEPDGWRTTVPANELVSGTNYVISGAGGDTYYGFFRYQEVRLRKVKNNPGMAEQFPPHSGMEWGEVNSQ